MASFRVRDQNLASPDRDLSALCKRKRKHDLSQTRSSEFVTSQVNSDDDAIPLVAAVNPGVFGSQGCMEDNICKDSRQFQRKPHCLLACDGSDLTTLVQNQSTVWSSRL